VPSLATRVEQEKLPEIPDDGPPYVEQRDLKECAGLVLGSPGHFGNIAAPLKHFLDGTTALWLSGALAGKPAAVFTSTGSLHGGQEATLLSMMIPLLHHGMLIMGLPYTQPELMTTSSGGSPYGATHWSGIDGDKAITDDEKKLAIAAGKRLAEAAVRLQGAR